ncbi:hypothetical protein EMA8858_03629 [Emticicia aquatica]|uniref:Lipoprotein n=1 Tax=Emticicia aquatica TaxID=1681835 RepID=A0ABN8EXL9_9BACT|nr:hypothetical protein [Emticicia aquatica]CAH0997496.1 hypothetical protein EMA8858_03629 [Emticicia aquatica]
MRKRIIEKIYVVLLLTTIFLGSCAVVCDLFSKDTISCVDTDIELLEDSNMNDSNETSIGHANNSIINHISLFSFDSFLTHKNCFSYLQNTYEIYLGLTTPPPKYL